MSSLPIVGYKIDSISRSSDGLTIFTLVNTRTGEKKDETFSKQKFEESPYTNQLELGKTERADANRRDEVAEKMANPVHEKDQYGLNKYLVDRLQEQGIVVKYTGKGNDRHPFIDTSNVHSAFLDDNGNIRSGGISSIPVNGRYIDSISRSSDGFTTFDVVDIDSGKLTQYIFSKDKWENASDASIRFYKKQLLASSYIQFKNYRFGRLLKIQY